MRTRESIQRAKALSVLVGSFVSKPCVTFT